LEFIRKAGGCAFVVNEETVVDLVTFFNK